MTSSQAAGRSARFFDGRGLLVGVAVGLPSTVAIGAAMATARSFFDTTNAALVLTIVVVAVAALGGRPAGVITALGAVASFDFFHTRPYLSLAIDSREDIETTVLLLVAGLFVGSIATAGHRARRREGTARSEIRRIHRVAEVAASGRQPAEVIAVAQAELGDLLTLSDCRFEAVPFVDTSRYPRIARNGTVELQPHVRFAVGDHGRTGFELPAEGAELPVLARGQQIGRFVLVPTPGTAVPLDDRLVAVAIADQVGAVWANPSPSPATASREVAR